MKRDNDLIREILRRMEQDCNGSNTISITVRDVVSDFPDVTQDIIDEHIQLLSESNLIEAYPTQLYRILHRLTPTGHDFIQNAKDPHIWKKTTQLAGHLSLDIISTFLKDVALVELKKSIGL